MHFETYELFISSVLKFFGEHKTTDTESADMGARL
jgi:hypothetical protein